jgi:hypothetical protein
VLVNLALISAYPVNKIILFMYQSFCPLGDVHLKQENFFDSPLCRVGLKLGFPVLNNPLLDPVRQEVVWIATTTIGFVFRVYSPLSRSPLSLVCDPIRYWAMELEIQEKE